MPEQLLQDAAIALHRAKAGSAVPYELFDPAMRERAVTRLQLETDLRNAIDNEEITVLYQPIISLVTGAIKGFEALARWHHPVRGPISPADFIPIAEDTGMIRQLGRLVLAESCRQMAAWQRQFGRLAPGFMCVNVSAGQFGEHDLAAEVETDPRRDRAGAVEAEAGDHRKRVHRRRRPRRSHARAACSRWASRWSIDDFGTGYSSLSYLHRLQANTVKVDRSFVSRMGVDAKGSEMVRAIVALALNLGMDVVAEGVETLEQMVELQTLGCAHAQGFYFSRPVNTAACDDLIASQPWREDDSNVGDEAHIDTSNGGSMSAQPQTLAKVVAG